MSNQKDLPFSWVHTDKMRKFGADPSCYYAAMECKGDGMAALRCIFEEDGQAEAYIDSLRWKSDKVVVSLELRGER